MNEFDYFVIIVLAISMLIGLWRGLTHELLSLAGWLVAFLVSKYVAPYVAPAMPGEATTQAVLAYVVLFIMTLILWALLVRLASKLIKAAGLGALDVVLGGMFGLLRGGLIVLVLAWLAGLTHIPAQPLWRSAQLSGTVEEVALATRIWLPESVAKRIQYRAGPTRRA